MPIVNNVTRLLDSKKFLSKRLKLPPIKLGADETARVLGVDPKLVYKTIVVTRPKGKPILAVIPGPTPCGPEIACSGVGGKKGKLANRTRSRRVDRFAGWGDLTSGTCE